MKGRGSRAPPAAECPGTRRRSRQRVVPLVHVQGCPNSAATKAGSETWSCAARERPGAAHVLALEGADADAPALAFEGNELRHIVNTDEDMAPLMNVKRRNDDVEVVTFEGAASTIDAVETSPRAARDFAESL